MRTTILGSCLAAVLWGCMPGMLPPVTPVQAQWAGQRWPDADLAQLGEARRLYINRCSGCHNLVLPAAEDLAQWQKILPKMALRANLNEAQRELIWRYIQTAKGAPADTMTFERAEQR